MALAAFAAAADDLLGPLPPERFPAAPGGHGPLVALCIALAVALAVTTYFYAMRRRKAVAPDAAGTRRGAPLPEPEPEALDAAEFYGLLLEAVRAEMDGRTDRTAQCLTARELANAATGRTEGWGLLCEHAERALYGGGEVAMPERAADLQVVRRFMSDGDET